MSKNSYHRMHIYIYASIIVEKHILISINILNDTYHNYKYTWLLISRTLVNYLCIVMYKKLSINIHAYIQASEISCKQLYQL